MDEMECVCVCMYVLGGTHISVRKHYALLKHGKTYVTIFMSNVLANMQWIVIE